MRDCIELCHFQMSAGSSSKIKDIAVEGSGYKFHMCLAPFICSIDVDFFDEGTTANNFAQIQNQYLLPMSLGICLS
jgi:hypothetical protein